MAQASPPQATKLAFDRSPELLQIVSVRSTKEKVDRVAWHPVQPWLAYVDRQSNVSVLDFDKDEASGSDLGPAERLAAQNAWTVPLPPNRLPLPATYTLPTHATRLSLQLLYDAQLGGADEAALQEAALRQRADSGGAAAAGQSATTAAMQEASLSAKGTASGLVKDIQFFDMDTCFWQIARQHWMQYGASDDHTIPYLGALGCSDC